MIGDKDVIDGVARDNLLQQPGEEHRIHARCNRQKQIGFISGGRAAGVDDDKFGAPLRSIGLHALEKNRMTPGGVRAHQHDEIGFIEILIAARHEVAAKGALVACDRRSHAEPRVCVHIRRPQKALHQFVGDVIILRQQLPREIKR